MSKSCGLCHVRDPLKEKADQMLKQVQKHDMMSQFWFLCHPELGSGSRFCVLEFRLHPDIPVA